MKALKDAMMVLVVVLVLVSVRISPLDVAAVEARSGAHAAESASPLAAVAVEAQLPTFGEIERELEFAAAVDFDTFRDALEALEALKALGDRAACADSATAPTAPVPDLRFVTDGRLRYEFRRIG